CRTSFPRPMCLRISSCRMGACGSRPAVSPALREICLRRSRSSSMQRRERRWRTCSIRSTKESRGRRSPAGTSWPPKIVPSIPICNASWRNAWERPHSRPTAAMSPCCPNRVSSLTGSARPRPQFRRASPAPLKASHEVERAQSGHRRPSFKYASLRCFNALSLTSGEAMRRREFIAFLGGAAGWPLIARAQQTERTRLIGVLMANAESDLAAQSEITVLRDALTKLGWTEGVNLRIELRWGGGDSDKIRRLAKELVDLRPDVILSVRPLL